MSATVHILPTASALDEAWERYAALIRATNEAPELRLDRDHMEATILAYQAFRDLFLATGRKS